MIIIYGTFLSTAAAQAECRSRNEMVVTAPQNGSKTLQTGITVRGYVCHNSPLITVRNETTASETITDTSEVCEDSECTYHFAAPVRGLAFGENHITARVNGEETRVKIDVIRTALAGM
ncbi:MAG TPA: hypothetical protein VFX30_04785 [bacterium]|nr:hypothetical protein [bacterium]